MLIVRGGKVPGEGCHDVDSRRTLTSPQFSVMNRRRLVTVRSIQSCLGSGYRNEYGPSPWNLFVTVLRAVISQRHDMPGHGASETKLDPPQMHAGGEPDEG